MTLSWRNPSFSGIPPFTMILLNVIDTNNTNINITRIIPTDNTTDPSSSSNVFRLDSLQSNTSYVITMRAVSYHAAVGDIVGPQSSPILVMTMALLEGIFTLAYY